MKKIFLVMLPMISALSIIAQDHSMSSHVLKNSNKLVWKNGPNSLPPGAKMTVLEGDMSKAESFTIRLSVPANYVIPPHWHPAIEHVTVIQGAFYMGMGEKYDPSIATKLTTGGFAVMPVKSPHFAFSKGKCIIQLHGVGPWGINYINDKDDPRKK